MGRAPDALEKPHVLSHALLQVDLDAILSKQGRLRRSLGDKKKNDLV